MICFYFWTTRRANAPFPKILDPINTQEYPHVSSLYLTYVNEYTLSFYILTVYVFLRMIIMGLRRVLLNALRSISRRHHGEGSRTQILHLYFTSTVSLFSTCSSCSCGLYFASPSCVFWPMQYDQQHARCVRFLTLHAFTRITLCILPRTYIYRTRTSSSSYVSTTQPCPIAH